MKNTHILRAMLVYFLLIVVSVVPSACCDDQELRISGSGNMRVFDLNEPGTRSGDPVEVVEGEFFITAEFLVEDLAFLPTSGIVDGAYAASCSKVFLNQFVEESLELTLDSDFILAGEIIPEGTNLADLDFVETRFGTGYGVVVLEFPEQFISEADFDDQSYTFRIKIRTDDNEQLTNEVTVRISI